MNEGFAATAFLPPFHFLGRHFSSPPEFAVIFLVRSSLIRRHGGALRVAAAYFLLNPTPTMISPTTTAPPAASGGIS